jgi:hypothetical protein
VSFVAGLRTKCGGAGFMFFTFEKQVIVCVCGLTSVVVTEETCSGQGSDACSGTCRHDDQGGEHQSNDGRHA